MIRSEIERAGGREVCFLAGVSPDRVIADPRAVARGNHQAVLAAARDAASGEILLHNHPSGILEPSESDLVLAARIYEEGLGTGIVDNEARALYVVVEPPTPRKRRELDADELEAVLAPGGALGRLHPGFENRPGQRAMLREVTHRFNEGGVAVVEAGTGTGKSLAYLIPAARWALENGERTVVSTNTINLQEQLVSKDLPMVRRLVGDELRWSLVKGRGNYVSIRRLLLAAESAPTLFESDRSREMDALVEWSRKTRDGSLADLATPPDHEIWDEVRSDSDICLGARCPHFQKCFYQSARREASSSDLLVVNHALLFADISVRRATENWSGPAVLPPYRHVVLDEGHNVEDAATSHLGAEVSRIGLFRTLSRLDRSGKGVLRSVEEVLRARPDDPDAKELVVRIRERVRPALGEAREAITAFFGVLEPRVPGEGEEPLRLGRGDPRDPSDSPALREELDRVTGAFGRLKREVEELRGRIEDRAELMDRLEGRVLDLRSVERRLDGGRHGLELVLDPGDDRDRFVRWVEGRGGGDAPLRNVYLAAAPVEPGLLLRDSLFGQLETAVVTSATLAVGRDGFRFLRGRLGLAEPARTPAGAEAPEPLFADGGFPVVEEDGAEPLTVTETLLPSSFDFPNQTLLGVPTDLAGHDAGWAFQEATARVVRDLAGITDGGVFVLFTSHRALRSVARILREDGTGDRWPLLVHGESPRSRLLDRFTGSGRGILLGTSSFWEGVDVPGDPLRGLILQKLPFRVPTEPITQARMEALEARGENAFRSYLVPLAALRLKQGFGRLIRSRDDRGAVLLLDPRILTRSYGRTLRAALPDAPLVKGPWDEVRARLREFYGCSGPGSE